MKPLATCWGCLTLAGLSVVPSACREREPVPPYSENLGTSDQPLLPTTSTHYNPELAKTGKKVELPKRPEPGAKAPATERPETAEAAPDTADAASNGAPLAKDSATTSGVTPEIAGTSGAQP